MVKKLITAGGIVVRLAVATPLCLLDSRTLDNLSLILKSSRIILLANGDEKQAVLEKAETDKTLPIYYLIHQAILPIEIESL